MNDSDKTELIRLQHDSAELRSLVVGLQSKIAELERDRIIAGEVARKREADLKARLSELAEEPRRVLSELEQTQETVRNMQARLRTNQVQEFEAQITGYNPTSGTPYTWKQMYATSAGLSVFTSGMRCTALTSGGGAIERNGWRFVASGTNVRMTAARNVNTLKFVFTAPVVPPSLYTTNQGLGLSSATKQQTWLGEYLCSG